MNSNSEDIIYIIPVQRIITEQGVLYENVSFPNWKCVNGMYCIEWEDKHFIVAPCEVVFSRKVTRLENIDPYDYAYLKRGDRTQDYVKACKTLLNIDLEANTRPQFRDGINPNKDIRKGYVPKKNQKHNNQEGDK